jgi:hypothetical protein
VIVNNFYFNAMVDAPDKADSPLVVDSNAMLARAITFQGFQPIRRGDSQVSKPLCSIEHTQLPTGDRLDLNRQAARYLAVPDAFCFLLAERLDHFGSITSLVM